MVEAGSVTELTNDIVLIFLRYKRDVLALLLQKHSIYLLYWYKSTNTDAAPLDSGTREERHAAGADTYADVC